MAHLAFVLFSHLHLCTSRFSGSYGCHRTISLHPSQLKLLSQFFFVHLFRVDVVCCLLLLRSVIFFWIRTRECTSHTYVTHKNVLGPFVNEIFVYVDNITAGVMSVDWLTRSMRVSVGATRVACLLYAPEHTHTHTTRPTKRDIKVMLDRIPCIFQGTNTFPVRMSATLRLMCVLYVCLCYTGSVWTKRQRMR